MRALLVAVVAAGLLAGALAGSGKDVWGIDTLVNYPAGEGRKTVPVQAGDVLAPAPIDLDCQCSDADPRAEDSQEVVFGCFWQKQFEKCNETYMCGVGGRRWGAGGLFDANAELAPEGFCQMSCSRCSCCKPLADVLRELGANRFLQAPQAVEASQPGLAGLLAHPGYTATLLVPTDAAFDAALARYQGLLQNAGALNELLKFHVLPPEPVRRGLWSSPFLSLGPKLYTLYDGPQTLSTSRFPLPPTATWRGGLTGFQIKGPFNAANVVKSDVPACKALVTVIDSVLLPWNPAGAPPADAAALVSAMGCAVNPNAIIAGQEIKAGDANRQATIGDCCASCAATSGCNAWRYCSQKGGCAVPETTGLTNYKYGYCQLLTSAEVAAGQPPAFINWDAVTVPLASGFIPRGGIPAAEVAAPLAAPTAPVTLAPAAAQFFSSAPAQAGVVQAADGSAGRKRF
ncbi:Beta-Ig-H3 fasciclin [Micractinium conductrix]|uniref:Beta-Ig-H3 fasciclin n=1 Tax=Micractinium conductrix TaxID=554055 RepID=A0A2P6VIQ8_9CHLO|nr:Beta-Ig-H3 fasciclin [Micractinium conductrix]|eukprot:PSC73937.1 Beta-Ig-H3 fasciclin [Micractinium conductrix]